MSGERRAIDIVLEPGYMSDLDEIDLDELRKRRAATEDVEIQISYSRRLLQGRMDLLAFEVRRRTGEEERSLLEALPEILATGLVFGPEPILRHLETMPPSPTTEGHRLLDRVLADGILTELPDLSDDEVHEAIDRLGDVEAELSLQRKQLHGVIDSIRQEIIARYRSQQGNA